MTEQNTPSTANPPEPARRPRVLVFDVNETLSDMSPMAGRFADLGVGEHLAQVWFAGLLRDGFALTAAGSTAPFADMAAETLRVLLAPLELDRGLEDAVDHVMGGFSSLGVHPDVIDSVRRLAELDLSLVTLSNGSTKVAEALLSAAGIRDHFERLLSVEDAGAWKPAAAAYAYGIGQCHVEPGDAMLVAVHPWDTDGAARAGLTTAWINRTGARYPSYFTPPTVQPTSLTELADHLR